MAELMSAQDLGRLLLRIAVGGLILLHGIGKLRHGVGPIVSMVTAHGLPSFVAYGVYVGEVVAPMLLLLGLWSRLAAGIIAIDMAMALWLAHATALFRLGKEGGLMLELPLLYLTVAISIALLGSGRYAIRPD